jgi:hypothetical protein
MVNGRRREMGGGKDEVRRMKDEKEKTLGIEEHELCEG